MKLYISGPMTGMPEHNFPAFHAAAADLRAQGWTVENPAEHFNGAHGLPWEVYMVQDIHVITRGCWGIAVLDGWEGSRGARLEVLLGRSCRLNLLKYRPGRTPVTLGEDEIRRAVWGSTSPIAASASSI